MNMDTAHKFTLTVLAQHICFCVHQYLIPMWACDDQKKNETSTLIVLKVLSSQMSVFLCDIRCSDAHGPAGGSRVRWGGRWALPAAQRGGRLPALWWCLLWSAGEGSHQRLGSTPQYLQRMTLESKTASQKTGSRMDHDGKSQFLHFHFAQKKVKKIQGRKITAEIRWGLYHISTHPQSRRASEPIK